MHFAVADQIPDSIPRQQTPARQVQISICCVLSHLQSREPSSALSGSPSSPRQS
jgi:hypothetical protein